MRCVGLSGCFLRKCPGVRQETVSPLVTSTSPPIREIAMGPVRIQPSMASPAALHDSPQRGEDLGFIRHQLDALAYARAVGGLRPSDETEYQRLCEQEQAMLDTVHLVVR
jgi:hypothetical protein